LPSQQYATLVHPTRYEVDLPPTFDYYCKENEYLQRKDTHFENKHKSNTYAPDC
jgi:hypothetical protein